jgi:hypothetical protein
LVRLLGARCPKISCGRLSSSCPSMVRQRLTNRPRAPETRTRVHVGENALTSGPSRQRRVERATENTARNSVTKSQSVRCTGIWAARGQCLDGPRMGSGSLPFLFILFCFIIFFFFSFSNFKFECGSCSEFNPWPNVQLHFSSVRILFVFIYLISPTKYFISPF